MEPFIKPSGCLWFCGLDNDDLCARTNFDPMYKNYRVPPGRLHQDYTQATSYCTVRCLHKALGRRPARRSGFTRQHEGGPSAVASAPERAPWVPSVDEYDLLPDASL